jgi:hypothetical protein
MSDNNRTEQSEFRPITMKDQLTLEAFIDYLQMVKASFVEFPTYAECEELITVKNLFIQQMHAFIQFRIDESTRIGKNLALQRERQELEAELLILKDKMALVEAKTHSLDPIKPMPKREFIQQLEAPVSRKEPKILNTMWMPKEIPHDFTYIEPKSPTIKNRLLEYCQRKRWEMPTFTAVSSGPGHRLKWQVNMTLNGRKFVLLDAPSKKEGEISLVEQFMEQYFVEQQTSEVYETPLEKEDTYTVRISKRRERQFKKRQQLFNENAHTKDVHKEYHTLSDEADGLIMRLTDQGYSTNLVKHIPKHLLLQLLDNYVRGYGILPIWQVQRMNNQRRNMTLKIYGEAENLKELPIPARDPEPGIKVRREILRAARLKNATLFVPFAKRIQVEQQGNVSTKIKSEVISAAADKVADEIRSADPETVSKITDALSEKATNSVSSIFVSFYNTIKTKILVFFESVKEFFSSSMVQLGCLCVLIAIFGVAGTALCVKYISPEWTHIEQFIEQEKVEKEFEQQGDEEDENKNWYSGIVVFFTWLVDLAKSLYGKTIEWTKIDWRSKMASLSKFSVDFKNITTFLESIKNGIKDILNWIAEAVLGMPFFEDSRISKEVLRIEAELTSLSTTLTSSPASVSPEYAKLYIKLYNRLREYCLEMVKWKGADANTRTQIYRLMLTRHSLFVECVNCVNEGVCRQRPFYMDIIGPTDQGKSTFIDFVSAAFYNRMSLPGKYDRNQHVYFRNQNDAFYSGYKDQPVTVLDDFLQVNDETVNAAEVFEVINMVNTTRMPLVMADLDSKGNTYFTSKMVITTSNTSGWPVNMGVKCNEAFYRRRDSLIRLTLLTKSDTLSVQSIDNWKIESATDVSNCNSEWREITFNELISWIVMKTAIYFKESQTLMNSLNDGMEERLEGVPRFKIVDGTLANTTYRAAVSDKLEIPIDTTKQLDPEVKFATAVEITERLNKHEEKFSKTSVEKSVVEGTRKVTAKVESLTNEAHIVISNKVKSIVATTKRDWHGFMNYLSDMKQAIGRQAFLNMAPKDFPPYKPFAVAAWYYKVKDTKPTCLTCPWCKSEVTYVMSLETVNSHYGLICSKQECQFAIEVSKELDQCYLTGMYSGEDEKPVQLNVLRNIRLIRAEGKTPELMPRTDPPREKLEDQPPVNMDGTVMEDEVDEDAELQEIPVEPEEDEVEQQTIFYPTIDQSGNLYCPSSLFHIHLSPHQRWYLVNVGFLNVSTFGDLDNLGIKIPFHDLAQFLQHETFDPKDNRFYPSLAKIPQELMAQQQIKAVFNGYTASQESFMSLTERQAMLPPHLHFNCYNVKELHTIFGEWSWILGLNMELRQLQSFSTQLDNFRTMISKTREALKTSALIVASLTVALAASVAAIMFIKSLRVKVRGFATQTTDKQQEAQRLDNYRAIKKELKHKPRVVDQQNCDPNGEDQAWKVFLNLHYVVCKRGTKSIETKILFVKNTIGFIVGHTFAQLGGVPDEIRVHWTHSDKAGIAISRSFAYEKVIGIEGKPVDLIILDIPEMPMQADIMSYISEVPLKGTLEHPVRIDFDKEGGIEKEIGRCVSFDETHEHQAPDYTYSSVYIVPDTLNARGQCGSVWFLMNTGVTEKLLGLHGAGSKHHGSLCEPIFKYMVENFIKNLSYDSQNRNSFELGNIYPNKKYLLTKSSEVIFEGVQTVAKISPGFRTPTKTKLYSTIFTKEISYMIGNHRIILPKAYNCQEAPALLGLRREKDGTLTDPFKLSLRKLKDKTIPSMPDFINDPRVWKGIFNDALRRHDVETLTMWEAIKGVPSKHIPPMDLKTSAAYPHSGMGLTREDLIDKEKEWMDEELLNEINFIISEAKKRKVTPLMCIACLKDERRPLDKVAKGYSRMFQIGSLAQLIVARMYLMPFIIAVESNLQGDIYVGCNPCSQDWEFIYRNCVKMGSSRIVAQDVSGWDLWFYHCIVYPFLKQYKDFYPNVTQETLNVIGSILLASFNPYVIFKEYVGRMSGMPSGCFVTSFFNSVLNSVKHRILWLYACRERKVELDFDLFNFLRVFGDDAIMAIALAVMEWWHGLTIARLAMKVFCHEHTSSLKGELAKFEDLEAVYFLQRQLRERDGVVYAPLNPNSIIGSLCYIMKGEAPEREQLVVNCHNALKEWAQHGKIIYEQQQKIINDRLRFYGEKDIFHHTYEEINSAWIEILKNQ